MKTIKFICAFVLLSTALLFSSCNDDDGGSDGSAASGTITGKVNGTTVTSDTALTVASRVTAGSTTSLTMQGTNFDGKGFSFNIASFNGEGTYEIGGSSLVFVTGNYIEGNAVNPMDTKIWSAPFDDDSLRGEIKFSTVTENKVIGTFQFTAKNPADGSTRQITEGSFNVAVTNY